MSFFYIYPYQIIYKNNTVNLFFILQRLDEAAESRLQPIRIQSTGTSQVPTFRLLRTTASSSCLQQAEGTLGNGKKVFYIYHPANAFFHRYCMIGKEKLRTSLPCVEQNQENLLKPIQATTNSFPCRLRTSQEKHRESVTRLHWTGTAGIGDRNSRPGDDTGNRSAKHRGRFQKHTG